MAEYTSSATMRVAYSAPVGGGLNVSAGPDQVIVFPNAVALTGTATDAYAFLGEVINVGWSQVERTGYRDVCESIIARHFGYL